ncbi:hypothetical protein GCM10010191_02790 [Actinomadura vinacea]|uniref:Major facilitator superfamily (MFS) profile domain-containing protein n=1 Tax=Actinomadura vinacea TaxID=115336 RepID=A0ABN3IAS3_9ACTN
MSLRRLLTTVAAQPAAADVYAMSAGRLGAVVAALVGLAGMAIGGLALARPAGRIGTNGGRGALVAGLSAMALGGLVVVTADGGLGTGNGLGGGIVALLVGLIGALLGGLALARSRRTG